MIDLIGEKFGKITVIDKAYVKEIGKDKKKRQYWKCQCDCGNIIIVMGQSLRSGNTKSCGCLLKENKGVRQKFNRFQLIENYAIGFDDKGNQFFIDKEDLELIKSYYWSLDNKGYWHTIVYKNGESHYQSLHKLVTHTDSSQTIDHINRNKNDNRKRNLRICKQKENCRNVSLGTKNTSGYLGVSWNKSVNKWTAQIKLNGKKKHLGCFVDIKDAVLARLKAEKELFGEFAPQKHLFKEYGIEND